MDLVNIFADGTSIVAAHKAEIHRRMQEDKEAEEAECARLARLQFELDNAPKPQKVLIEDDPKLEKTEEGKVSMRDEHAHVKLLPAIDRHQVGNYYGDEAKSRFYETYHKLDRRRKIMWSPEGDTPEDELMRTIAAPRPYSPFTGPLDLLREAGITRSRPSSKINSRISVITEGLPLKDSIDKRDFDSFRKNELKCVEAGKDGDFCETMTSEEHVEHKVVPASNESSDEVEISVAPSNNETEAIASFTVPDLNFSSSGVVSESLTKEGNGNIHSKEIVNDGQESEDDELPEPGTYDQYSPRATFLAGCLKLGIPPRTSAILRKRLSSKLSLRSIGIGDEVGLILASSLNTLPFVSSLDLSDNNLTDASMRALFEAIETNPNISEIDFSTNDMDHDSAVGLAKYLGSNDCALKKLVLQAADIDDGETEMFVGGLMTNKSLEELDLSRNLLGKDEVLNAVKPDLVTGGEAIAGLLRADECVLKTLRLSWNMIRMQSACDLCDSLSYNKTLTYLDLSYNSIGSDGGCTLGRALLTNKSLIEIHLKNNMIDPVGCFTICVGARETTSLRILNLDGNPIGEAGARALMTIPLVCGARLEFSAKECDLGLESNKIILNRREPVGRYELNMESDYGRAVLYDIFDVVANHSSLIIKSFQLSLDGGSKWTDLKFKKIAQRKQFLTDREIKEVENQKYIEATAQHEDRIIELFNHYDEDGSGELDYHEFTDLLNEFGMSCTEKEGKAIIESVDTDGGGLLELDEIIAYVRKLGEEAPNKIFNLEHRFTMSQNKSTERYIPPEKGHVRVQILDSFVQSDVNISLTRLQCLDLIDASKNSSSPGTLLALGADNVRMRVDEAEMIHSEISRQSGNPIRVLSKLLPLVSSVYDSRRLLNYIVGDSQSKTLYLKKLMGPAYRPIIGVFDGYYHLDLSVENDRVCLSKLFEQNNTTTHHRLRHNLWDVSQDGNWSSFRNESRSIGKNDVTANASICVENFTPIPKHGHLEFDFSGSHRPVPHHDIPISNRKLFGILKDKLKLLDPHHTEWAYDFMNELEIAERKTLNGQGFSFWQPDIARAKAVSAHIEYLYENLHVRKDQVNEAIRSEFLAVDIGQAPLSEEEEAKIAEELAAMTEEVQEGDVNAPNDGRENIENGSKDGEGSKCNSVPNGGSTIASTDTVGEELNLSTQEIDAQEVAEEENLAQDVAPPEEVSSTPLIKPVGFIRGDNDEISVESNDDSESGEPTVLDDHAKLINYGSHDTIADRLALIQAHGGIADEAMCVCIMEYAETFMSTRWIKAAQLALLVSCFEVGRLRRSDFGSYRVELIILLYTRLIDIHNFEFVLMNLNAEEHACVIARIGPLNLFNPWKPEGAFQLDLSRWEERQVAKMLSHLSVTEPGENWPRCEFSSVRGVAPMPGWCFNETWFTEDGFPYQGLLTVLQFSGDGMFRRACQADIKLRAKLLSLVLIDVKEIHLGEKQPENAKFIHTYGYENACKSIGEVGMKWSYCSNPVAASWADELENCKGDEE